MIQKIEDWYNELPEPYRCMMCVAMIMCWNLPISLGMQYGITTLVVIGFIWLVLMLVWGIWRNL
jgi:hypothetical protein